GSALGYLLGGVIGKFFGWRAAFWAMTPPGLLLGVFCFFMKDPPRGSAATQRSSRPTLRDYLALFRIRSYVLDTAGMMAMTFAIGGISFWMPHYLVKYRFPQQFGHPGDI